MNQAKDNCGNLRWFVWLASGERKITWAPSEAEALAKAHKNGFAFVAKVEPAPPLLNK